MRQANLFSVWRTVFTSLIIVAQFLVSASAGSLKAGTQAPDFTLKSADGKNLKLSELRGEVVLLNFWATWCAPCQKEMPLLDQLYTRYRRAGFSLLAVSVDNDPAKATAMAKKLRVTFPVLFDKGKRVSRLYAVDAMPSTLILDRDGRVRFIHRGYRPGYEKIYQEHIKELLRE